MNRLLIVLVFVAASFHRDAAAQSKPGKFPIIPYPTSLQPKAGAFVINAATILNAPELFGKEAGYLQQLLQNASGYALKFADKPSVSNCIELRLSDTVHSSEGYSMIISPQKIILAAKTPTGIYRAIQTIRQLLPVAAEAKTSVTQNIMLPAVVIHDAPVYEWRGMHLDVSRHFFSIDYLKKFIDVMTLYKMNKFHLHLTDDQGWRIEIKKYPRLTEEGAWRTFNEQDSVCMKQAVNNPDMAIDPAHIVERNGKTMYGGFYTQDQIKDLVAYAATKHIDIIPEIDMPGHMMAAIASYPFLSCNNKNEKGELFTTPICPCDEYTYEFAENIFSEIFELFPSEYIHIGADEVDRKSWGESTACKELMQREGLKDLGELQSYFVNRMEKFFQSKGKKLVGWDEILEGGISKTAYVMFWRDWVRGQVEKAVKSGNYLIMTPGTPLYFDRVPDANSLKDVYDFKLVKADITAEEAKFIIGAQANIWTEYIPSENRADFMYMPRMTALAEKLWSSNHDFKSYMERLAFQYKRLDALKVHYRLPDITGIAEENVFTDKTVLDVKPPLASATIHYTTDGSLPTQSSMILNKPLGIDKSVTVKIAAFNSVGLRGDIYTLHYKKESYAIPAPVQTALKSGLACSYYKKYFKTSTLLSSTKADSVFTATNFIVPAVINAPSFGLQYKGYIDVPETGIYTFYLTCDDGGILYIANRTVVNNDGLHAPVQKSGQVALQKGLHPFQLDFIEGGGGYKLELKYSKSNGELKDVPDSWLKY